MPLERGVTIVTKKKNKTYSISISPQAEGKYEKDKGFVRKVNCIASSMSDVFTYLSAILTNSTSYSEIDSRNIECGRWNNGNKYFVSILGYENFSNAAIEGKTIIDGDTILNKILENQKIKWKEQAEKSEKVGKDNPPHIIHYVEKKISFLDKLLNAPSIISEELLITIPSAVSSQTIEVGSDSNFNTYYEINLSNVTCSCKDFIKRKRIRYDKNDIRRYCKHLAHKIIDNKEYIFSDIVRCILKFGNKDTIRGFTFSSGIKYYIAFNKKDLKWIDVFARKRKIGEKNGHYTGAYERYGYSILEKRWSYGDGPDGASVIKKTINTIFDFN